MKITRIIASARDLDGDMRHFRWLAIHFGQDTDISYASFEEAAEVHILSLTAEDRSALRLELHSIIEQCKGVSEAAALERGWYRYGAQWWPDGLSVVEGLAMIDQKISEAEKV